MPHKKTIQVPVELRVSAFTLPSASEFRTVVDFVESPESVALQYKVPLWSDAHFRLVAKSFRAMGLVGNRTVYLPLVARTNFGNEQSLVRWIRKPDGSFDHDYSVLERYLDTCIANMGRPRIVCLYAWDVFLGGQPYGGQDQPGRPTPVTCVDPATGAVSTIELPRYGTPEAAGLWRPVAAGVTARLKARGLDGCAMIGLVPDGSPSTEAVAHFREVFPGLPWMRHSHSNRKDLKGAPIGYQCLVWTPRFAERDGASQAGWKRAENWTQFCRSQDAYPPVMARLLGEMNITGSQRGFGRIGLDFWQVLEDRKGRRAGTLQARYPESAWANLDWMIRDFVPPGPDGAMLTARLEVMREGLQECEARIVVEDALGDPARRAKLGDALAKRAEDALRARTLAMLAGLDNHLLCGFGRSSTQVHGWWGTPGQVGHLWFRGSGWQDRSAELFDLAAEVQRAAGR